jgi:hypothetical protein
VLQQHGLGRWRLHNNNAQPLGRRASSQDTMDIDPENTIVICVFYSSLLCTSDFPKGGGSGCAPSRYCSVSEHTLYALSHTARYSC